MPIVDVQIVCKQDTDALSGSAQALADSLGRVFGSGAGGTWVRVHGLLSACYAENEASVVETELPAFVTVLQAHPPQGEAFTVEVMAVTKAVAACIGRPVERVHVQYSPPGAGRQAFGGKLVE